MVKDQQFKYKYILCASKWHYWNKGNVPKIYNLSMKLFPRCRLCHLYSLDPNLVKGKIVLCEDGSGLGPLKAGAVGFLIQGQSSRDYAFSFVLSGSYLELKDGVSVYGYIKSTGYISIRYNIQLHTNNNHLEYHTNLNWIAWNTMQEPNCNNI